MRSTYPKCALFLLVIWAVALQVRAQDVHSHPAPEKLGTVSFPTSCQRAVQADFDRAVALLHSFAYEASESSFRAVAEKDPKCAMAYWGMSMTHFHQLWEPPLSDEDLKHGQQEIEQALKIGGNSIRERLFIDALASIYRGADHIPYRTRSEAYERGMAEVASRNPADIESQIFYALALLSTAVPTDKTHVNQKRAEEILQPLFRKQPQHPGVAHYLIHACDNSEMASRGLVAARAYSTIAPSAPHALHMPSHIFTRLGLWQDSVVSNLAAREAAARQGDIGEEWHAMDYLMYAYLQLGNDDAAERLLRMASQLSRLRVGEFKVGYAATALPARYAVERRQWAEAAALEPIPGAEPQVTAVTLWARAVGLSRNGKPAAAAPDIERLTSICRELRAGGNDYWATQAEIEAREAKAWQALAEGRATDALSGMSVAAHEEDAVEKLPLTPGPIVPAREQLGDMLLELGRPKEALRELESALSSSPNRRGALSDIAHARALLGERPKDNHSNH